MGSILQRLFYGLDGKEFPVVQNLHWNDALLCECEWDWKAAAETGAHCFADHAVAESRVAEFTWQDGSGHVVKPFAVTCSGPDREARARREEDRIATALAGAAADGLDGRKGQDGPPAAGVSPGAMTSADARVRRRASKANRGVATERKAAREAVADEAVAAAAKPRNRVETMKQVYARMERRHPHEQVYAETQRRLGEHDD